MIEEENFDSSDVESVKGRKRKVLLNEKQKDLDLFNVMNTPVGRSVIWELLSIRGIGTSSFVPDPYITAFNEGNRNMTCVLTNELLRVCPELYLLAQKEAIAKNTGVNHG